MGEGAIWVCNSNGNIENRDYITSSDYLGNGEKQDYNLLHNYTVTNAKIDCDFQLDSPYYNCLETENGLRIAFISWSFLKPNTSVGSNSQPLAKLASSNGQSCLLVRALIRFFCTNLQFLQIKH